MPLKHIYLEGRNKYSSPMPSNKPVKARKQLLNP
jgi:hypothetical protein